MTPSLYRIWIGLDPGTHCGMSVWDRHEKTFLSIVDVKIHEAMFRILSLKKEFPESIFVRMEDARLRRWFGEAGREKLQGVGSIKRDCSILEDFLTDYQIPFECVKPESGMTKWNKEFFQQVTGWMQRTTDHSRDAAVLVFQK